VSATAFPDLDALTEDWRLAFAAAEDALHAETGRLDALELRHRAARLTEERRGVAGLLEAFARENHLRLRRSLSAPRATRRMLGLPSETAVCLFDLDGVLTASASLHAAAWAETFDEFLAHRMPSGGEEFAHLVRPFDPHGDYIAHLHGRPRLEGVREFLASRAIRLPEGDAQDRPGRETVNGLANRKNEVLGRLLEREGVAAYAGSRRFLEAVREAGVHSVVISASANTAEILERSGLAGLVDEQVDGRVMRRERLHAKPAPDTLRAACRLLAVAPGDAAAFETTSEGIAAARSAGIRLVVGVDRTGDAEVLREAGADRVVGDPAELLDAALAA
jgi:HAD superfamily hydrolase (TIGR01509 family)